VEGASAAPPVGTIAMLFTDVASSTELARTLGPGWREVLAAHHAIVGGAITAEDGWIDGTEGDAFFATFADPAAAGRAAVAAQRGLAAHPWPAEAGAVTVRMGLHVGHVVRAGTGYVGLEVHRAARIAAAAHGGQLLLSDIAARMLSETVVSESVGIHRLKDFPQPEALFCAVIDGRGASAFPPPRAEARRPNNLPAGAQRLVGRDDDLARIRDALITDRERLVTITGRGGAGKTTLALAVAGELLDAFPGGVWLTSLATLEDAEDVPKAIASAVGATFDIEGTASAAIVARLRARDRTLVVLDNCEHVIGMVPELAALLGALPDLQVLATSQAPLHLSAELVVALDALDDADALALVARVATRRNPGISVGGRDRDALIELVHLLDGLPLALEVAAARLTLLSPAQLTERLRASPDVLRDDRSDRPARQRSLRATVQWSLRLLDPATKTLFARLGAFAGPVELEELEVVCGGDELDVIGELFRLLEVALVRRVEHGDGRIRFGLPEGLRRIAADELDDAADGDHWRRAHAEHQRDIIWPVRTPSVSRAEYDRAVAATAERRRALQWSRTHAPEVAQTIAAGHAILAADLGQLREAVDTVEPLLADPPSSADAVITAGIGAVWALLVGRTEEALPHADRAVDAADDPQTRAAALTMRCLALTFVGRTAEAVLDSEEAVRQARLAGDADLGAALVMHAQSLLAAGELDAAARALESGTELLQRTDVASAWKRFTVAGDIAAAQGRTVDALELYARSLQEAELRRNESQIMFDLAGTAAALAGLRADAAALEVEAMARVLASELGGPGTQVIHLLDRSEIERARERLGPASVSASDRGRATRADARVARACELVSATVSAERPSVSRSGG
jgi:predicted ATPase/class 3 adenylate cyclase